MLSLNTPWFKKLSAPSMTCGESETALFFSKLLLCLFKDPSIYLHIHKLHVNAKAMWSNSRLVYRHQTNFIHKMENKILKKFVTKSYDFILLAQL